jgi:hypothetical protein
MPHLQPLDRVPEQSGLLAPKGYKTDTNGRSLRASLQRELE